MAANALASPPRSQPASESRWAVAGICFLLVALVLAVFGKCIAFDFVNYDDRVFVTKNAHVLRGLTWENVSWALTAGCDNSDVDIDYWRPLSMISHILDVQLFGLSAGGHHAVSVGLHALVAVALFLVLRGLTGAFWRCAWVACVFAVHPLHVESVAWISERKDVLSGLFFVLALGAYARFVRRPFHLGNYFLVVLMFALGLMSKPMLVTLPCVLLLLDWWPLNRVGTVPWARLGWEKIPLFGMSAVAAVVAARGPGGAAEDVMAALPLPWRAGNAVTAVQAYLAQTAWPTALACFYPHPGRSLPLGSIVLAASVVATITCGTLLLWRRRYLAVGWFWFIGMLVPVSGLLQSGFQARADRYTYLPMIGLTCMIAWAAADIMGRRRWARFLVSGLGVAVIPALSAIAYWQVDHWKDSEALWTHTLTVTKDNANAYNYIGLALKEQGRTAEAAERYQQALALRPDYAEAHCNLGAVLFPAGQREQALEHMRKAVEGDPRVAAFHYNLGNALLQLGRLAEAEGPLETTLELDSRFSDACNNLAFIRYQQGRREEAIAYYRRVVELNPLAAEPRRNLGYALLTCGQSEEALAQYEKSVQLEPGNAAGLALFAWVLATCPDDAVRNGARAVELALRADQLSGGTQPMLLRTLAAAYAEGGQFEEALRTVDRALEQAAAINDQSVAGAIQQIRPIVAGQLPVRDTSLKAVR